MCSASFGIRPVFVNPRSSPAVVFFIFVLGTRRIVRTPHVFIFPTRIGKEDCELLEAGSVDLPAGRRARLVRSLLVDFMRFPYKRCGPQRAVTNERKSEPDRRNDHTSGAMPMARAQ